MGNLFKSFTFKIWLPFAVALLIIISVSAWYYPKKQKEFLLKNKSDQILELSKIVAKSYELAFTDADEGQVLLRLKEIIDFVEKDHDIDYIEIYENNKLWQRHSKNDKQTKNITDKKDYFFKDSEFEYLSNDGKRVKGFVRIAVLKKGIEEEIAEMNRPIYFILFGITIFFLVAFYFLARWISKPIIDLTKSSIALSNQDYSQELPDYQSEDEIGVLIKSINQLKVNLIDQKAKNDKFVFGLEELVGQRTKDLESTQHLLFAAQKNAQFGTFKYNYTSDTWTASSIFNEIIGIDKNYPNNLKGLLALFQDKKDKSLSHSLDDLISSGGQYFTKDFKVHRSIDNKIISLNLVVELKYENNEPLEIIGSVQDITQRINFQEEIERLSHVATKTTNLVIITDENKKIEWVNDAVIKMTEYSREEIIGNTPKMFQYEKTNADTVKLINEKLNKHEVIAEIEIQNQSKSGREYWLSINIVPIKDNNGNLTGFIAIESDITQSKVQLELIAKSEKNYRNLLDFSSEMVHTLDHKGCLKYANQAWLENMKFESLEDVQGKPLMGFLTPATLKEFSMVMPKLMKGEKVNNLDCEFIANDKEILNIRGRSQPVMIDGEFAGSEAYLFNVTNRLKTQKELDQMSKLQNLLMKLSTEYINAPVTEIDRLINESLAEIAEFSSADRAYVFRYDYEKEICSITNEWVGKGIQAQINELTAMPFADVPYSLGKHTKGDFVEFPDVSKVKDKRIHSVLSGEGIQSLISIPMMDGDTAIGFIGFDIMQTKREFSVNEKNLFRIYSEMIVNVFNRKKFIEELQSTKEALSNINVSLEKKVLENTRKNIDLSRSILEQEKLVTIGEISAGIAHDLNTPLGTIRVGSDNVSFIINKLFKEDLSRFSREDLVSIINYVKENKIEIYIGGLQIRKEKEDMFAFLSKKYSERSIEELNKFAELLVKCRISSSKVRDIDELMNRPNGIEYLELLCQVQMAMAQLDTIKTSSDKAVRVVQDMRAFIKGETTVESKKINLRENIATVLSVFNYEISLNVDLKFDVSEDIEFTGYDIKLFQLWSNIVKNALEAMIDQEDKYLGINAVQEKNKIVVTFENNGPKIPKNIVKKIFNKFYSTKSKKSGSGLGLSIVKNVLKEHEADIKLESTDKITKFIITFDI